MDQLNRVISEEMFKMAARRVDYTPNTEEAKLASVRMMQHDLAELGLGDADAPRVRAAFQSIAVKLGRWPTAYMIRDHMPPKPVLPPPPKPRPPMPEILARRLRELGLDQRPGETKAQQAQRCREWLRKRKTSLPANVKRELDESEREDQREREAIQTEGT